MFINKSNPVFSDIVGFFNKVFATIFCAIPLAYLTPSNVWSNCPDSLPSPSTIANDGYK